VEWKSLCNEEVYDLYCSPNIIWVIKARTLRWVGHVARMTNSRDEYRDLMGTPEGKRQF